MGSGAEQSCGTGRSRYGYEANIPSVIFSECFDVTLMFAEFWLPLDVDVSDIKCHFLKIYLCDFRFMLWWWVTYM